MNKITFIVALFFIGIGLLVFNKDKTKQLDAPILKETSVILAFGDSLTYGFGAGQEFSYPKHMQAKTGLNIINAGVNGEVSSQGLLRLPSLLEHSPDLVILCHGGNDIIQKLSSQQLKDNLIKMIQLIHESGAQVLLVGVPDFSLYGFHTHDIYQEVAEEMDVLFEDKILTHIEMNRSLKSDYVHPNAKGYELMADTFIEILQLTQ